jgi:hypothetical protein
MNQQTLLDVFLVLHIAGFTTMTGTVAVDTTIYGRLRKYLVADKGKALTMLESSASFPALIGISAALIIISGIGMVSVIPAFAGMLWFRVKMILVLGLILNGAISGRRLVTRLKHLLLENTEESNQGIDALKRRMNLLYVTQLVLILAIFILSVFKF